MLQILLYMLYIIHYIYTHIYKSNLLSENQLSIRTVRGQGIAKPILIFSQKASNEG